jgi:proline iminopeptidase
VNLKGLTMLALFCNLRCLNSIISLFLLMGMLSTAQAADAKVSEGSIIPEKLMWEESFAASSDGKIFYAKAGTGPAIVLIPGGPGGSSWTMRHSFAPLAQWFTLIAIDNIGRGRSDALANPKLHSVARDARDIEVVRKHLRLDTLSVYGHSYGGYVAMQYALDFGPHLEKLMLGDTGHGAKSWQQSIDDSNYMVQQLYPDQWQKLMSLRSKGVLSSDPRYLEIYDETEGDVYMHDVSHPPPAIPKSPFAADHEMNQTVYQAFLGNDPEWRITGSLAHVEYLPLLKKLRMPVLIVVGRFDRVAQPRFAYSIRDAIKNAPVELALFEKSAHRPMREEPQAFQERIKAFMDSSK